MTPHPLAGKVVKLSTKADHPQFGSLDGKEVWIEDWWINVFGKSWMYADGNPAAMIYAMRSARTLPLDDKVLYGKLGGFGLLIHVSEIAEGHGGEGQCQA